MIGKVGAWFDENVKGSLIVGGFLLLLLFGFCHETKAETSFEVGPAVLSSDYAEGGMFAINERFGKYELGMGYVSEQVVHGIDIRENLFVEAKRVVKFGEKFEMALGPAYFQNTNRALGCKFTGSLSMTYNFTDNWGVKVRHFSNAGSCSPNLGQDAFTIQYRFK